jgi:hypothetical protein
MLGLDCSPNALHDTLDSVHTCWLGSRGVPVDAYFLGLGQHGKLQPHAFPGREVTGQLGVAVTCPTCRHHFDLQPDR